LEVSDDTIDKRLYDVQIFDEISCGFDIKAFVGSFFRLQD